MPGVDLRSRVEGVWSYSGIINLGKGESTEGFRGYWNRVDALPPINVPRDIL